MAGGGHIDRPEGGAERRPQRLGGREWGLILFGLAGVAVLVSLCVWQLQRLAWKEGVIAQLAARMEAPARPLPAALDAETQEFSRVRLTGRFDGRTGDHGFADAPLLTARKFDGPGYRVIQPFTLADGRTVMVDRGYVPIEEKNRGGAAAVPTPAPEGEIEIEGVLRWPDEADGPAFGANDNVWTARDMGAMARLFGAEPVLVVASTSTAVGRWPEPEPLTAVSIRNDHLEYAITWALLALVWAAMTGGLVWRRLRDRMAGARSTS